MKRINLIFVMCLLFVGQPLYGQWYFQYMCGINDLQRQGGYATKQQCEAAARAMDGSPCNGNGWGKTINVPSFSGGGHCLGKDLPVSTANNTGQTFPGMTDFDNFQQGKGVITSNPYDELIDGMEEYLYREQVLYFNEQTVYNEMPVPATSDAEYNAAVQSVYPRKINKK
jgi:hypothetical protein